MWQLGINTTVGMLQKEVWISWLSVFNVKTTITVLKTHLGIVRMPYPLILIITLRLIGYTGIPEKCFLRDYLSSSAYTDQEGKATD